jgi:hypothetical protein
MDQKALSTCICQLVFPNFFSIFWGEILILELHSSLTPFNSIGGCRVRSEDSKDKNWYRRKHQIIRIEFRCATVHSQYGSLYRHTVASPYVLFSFLTSSLSHSILFITYNCFLPDFVGFLYAINFRSKSIYLCENCIFHRYRVRSSWLNKWT